MKCSEGLSNKVSNIIRRYTDHMNVVAYIDSSFIAFLHVLLVPCFFKSLCVWFVCLCLIL